MTVVPVVVVEVGDQHPHRPRAGHLDPRVEHPARLPQGSAVPGAGQRVHLRRPDRGAAQQGDAVAAGLPVGPATRTGDRGAEADVHAQRLGEQGRLVPAA